jgi:hypothetical protein
MSLATMLESSCRIERPGIKEVWPPDGGVVLADGMACSVQAAGASVITMFAQRETLVDATLYFEDDPGAQVNDRITVYDDNGAAMGVYLVQGSDTYLNLRWQSPWFCHCQRIR